MQSIPGFPEYPAGQSFFALFCPEYTLESALLALEIVDTGNSR